MQGRHRNPNDGRGYNSNYRNFNRGSGGGRSFGRKPYLPPPARSKKEILMEAGRLAAEYLVYKGLLPPDSLPPKWQNGNQGYKGSPVADGRPSALNRLGSMNSDVGNGRRRYNDEYNNRMEPRNQFRGKKRMGPYDREYGDWEREDGRWMNRNRGYNDMEGEDDFAPGYNRDRQGGFHQLPSRSEYTGESGSENRDVAEDTGSKVSSSSTRRDVANEVDGDLSKAVADDTKGINSEAGDEVKSDASGELKKVNQGEESDVQPCETEGESKSGDDLMKLCSFARVPTKPRSSPAQKGPKMDQGLTVEASHVVEGSSGEPKATSGEYIEGDSSNKSPIETDPESQAPQNLSTSALQPVVESVDQGQEGSQGPVGSDSLKTTVDKEEEEGEEEEKDRREGMKRQRDSSMDEDLSLVPSVRAKKSSPEIEEPTVDEVKIAQVSDVKGPPTDEEMVDPVATDQEKPCSEDFIRKGEHELNAKLDEEKQLIPASFKICDLNLMQAPEITEIPDDPERPRRSPPLQTDKQVSMDFGLSIGNNSNEADDFSRLSVDDKVVQVIDLEDDSIMDASASDPLKPM